MPATMMFAEKTLSYPLKEWNSHVLQKVTITKAFPSLSKSSRESYFISTYVYSDPTTPQTISLRIPYLRLPSSRSINIPDSDANNVPFPACFSLICASLKLESRIHDHVVLALILAQAFQKGTSWPAQGAQLDLEDETNIKT